MFSPFSAIFAPGVLVSTQKVLRMSSMRRLNQFCGSPPVSTGCVGGPLVP